MSIQMDLVSSNYKKLLENMKKYLQTNGNNGNNGNNEDDIIVKKFKLIDHHVNNLNTVVEDLNRDIVSMQKDLTITEQEQMELIEIEQIDDLIRLFAPFMMLYYHAHKDKSDYVKIK